MSLFIAFPCLRTHEEYLFYLGICGFVRDHDLSLEVLCLPGDEPLVSTGLPNNVVSYQPGDSAESVFKRLTTTPSKALIHNNLLLFRKQLQELLREEGVQVKIWERSPLAGFQWVEDDIFFGGSKLHNFWNATAEGCHSAEPHVLEMLNGLSDDLDGARNYEIQSHMRAERSIDGSANQAPFLLFLMDNTLVTGWGAATPPHS